MVISCVAYNCVNRQDKSPGLSFHRFPLQNKALLEKWIHALRRDKWTPSKYSRLCSAHFVPECYEQKGWCNKKELKDDAVPSIFDFPEHLQKIKKTRRSPRKRKPPIENSSEDIDLSSCIDHGTPSSCNSVESETEEPKQKKKRESYIGDFVLDENLPSAAVKCIEKSRTVIADKNKRIKILKQRNRRLLSKIKTLESLVEHLRNKHLASEEALTTLLASVPEGSRKIFTQMLKGNGKGEKYPPELRSFAMTLDFYSPKAYDYVRQTFNKCLPHRRTIQKWYRTVSCKPGFSEEALTALKLKKAQAAKKNRKVVCSILMDEMSIRKLAEYRNGKVYGYVDFGNEVDDDNVPLAKEVLVFMLNSLNDSWKLPVGYFFLNGMTAEEKAELIKKFLHFIKEADIELLSLTFDGLASNQSMCHHLGANFNDVDNLKPYFVNPVNGKKIFIFFDPPHMLKLLRNALGTFKLFNDEKGDPICWEVFEALVKAQEDEGLHLGTKIRKAHILWFKQKMKVKLAAQIFSATVANAIKYLRKIKYSEIFENSLATENFANIINRLFDIMNSRNIFAYGFKRGLDAKNKDVIFDELDRIANYLKNLKNAEGQLLIRSPRKAGFLGFLIDIESLKGIFHCYVATEGAPLKYILTYKMSQDHLEVFFSCIRSRGGFNNNPSAYQFQCSYKRLLLHSEIKGSKYGNCIELNSDCPISILNISSAVIPSAILPTGSSAEELRIAEEKFLKAIEDEVHLDHDYDTLYFPALSEYLGDVTSYIAGFVSRSVRKKVACPECSEALVGDDVRSLLQEIKQYKKDSAKGLLRASDDVIYLCQLAERVIRGVEHLPLKGFNTEKLTIKVLQAVGKPIFNNLKRHVYDENPLGNHVVHLSKLIISTYLKIRIHHKLKSVTEESQKSLVRHLLTKQILFYNQ